MFVNKLCCKDHTHMKTKKTCHFYDLARTRGNIGILVFLGHWEKNRWLIILALFWVLRVYKSSLFIISPHNIPPRHPLDTSRHHQDTPRQHQDTPRHPSETIWTPSTAILDFVSLKVFIIPYNLPDQRPSTHTLHSKQTNEKKLRR